MPIAIVSVQHRWVLSKRRGELHEHCEKTRIAYRFSTMAPKNHPRAGNRRKDYESTGTKNTSSSKKPTRTDISAITVPEPNVANALPIELQQTVLNVVANAFPLAENQVELKTLIQEVKGHLYNRDFATAFGKQDYLAAYALRWSATRALAYASIFVTFDTELRWAFEAAQLGEEGTSSGRIVCIGGGAGAEALALAAVVKHRQLPGLQMEALDIADWSHCLEALRTSLMTPPPVFKFASESVRAANRSLLKPEQLGVSFRCEDVLAQTQGQLKELMTGTKLVTLMFTLNELFTTSIPQTTAFLLNLTDAAEPGTCLLVVDSPGSYSEVKLGKDGEAKKYPMKWLLDHTLLESAGEGKWDKRVRQDSKWFRLDSKLKYPIDLEDMRYQVHIYERSGTTDRNPN